LVLASPLWADPPPPNAPDPISLDRASPSVNTFGNTIGDIYGEVPPSGIVGQGWDIAAGVGPILHVPDVAYGLILAQDNNDGHSNGEADPNAPLVIYFSGDDASRGAPWTEYRWQANLLQAAGDRFVTNGFTSISPMAVLAGVGGPAFIFGPIVPGRPINMVSANQTRYNEIPSIAIWAMNMYIPAAPGVTVMDDMDALELLPMDLDANNVHDTPIYFTLDAGSPSVVLGGFSQADVLVSPPGGPGFFLFAGAATLGLSTNDEVDALAVWDFLQPGSPDAGWDCALFSLAPGSPYLAGPDGVWGTADDWSAADIFVTGFTGFNVLYISAPAIGMLFTDNVDALDVEVFRDESNVEVWEEFMPDLVILDLILKKGGASVVVRDPPPLDPNDPLWGEYFLNEQVTLTAVAAGSKTFKRWKMWDPNDPMDPNLVVIDTNNPTTIVMSSDRTVTAVFKCGGAVEPFAVVVLLVLGLGVIVRRLR
jgi:hypothetical protein